MKKLWLLIMGLVASASLTHATLIADFTADYQFTTPAPGWSYLWNSGGVIGTPANYTALAFDSGYYNLYVITPGTVPALPPGAFTYVGPGFMHPGFGTTQVPNPGALERFAIAAFTLSTSGYMILTNGSIADNAPGGGDGVSLFINVNGNAPLFTASYAANFSATPFGVIDLGYRTAGDTIYVAVGSKADSNFDQTLIQFQIVQIPEPSTVFLCLTGAGLVWWRRRRK